MVLLKLFPVNWIANDLLLASVFALFLGLGRLARFGSRSSYSLYATHLPLVVFLCNFLVPTARIPASPLAWALVLAIPAVAVAFVVLFSRLTEDRTAAARKWASGVLKPSPGVS